ncbi:MAG: hypothetical protein RLY31_2190 [Bacteroidota bacterium]|jgi:XTP/dITP diphosphohydrolase
MKMTAPTNPTDYRVDNLPAKLDAFARLLQIMDDLREKCPWDRKQTFSSLRNLTIEETYELADAILDGNPEEIREEVGDLLLHLVFYAKIAEETGAWDIASALHGICDKLVTRHPHVYGDLQVADEDAVKRNWEQLKLQSGKSSILQGVPTSLPAVVKAWRMQQKTAQVGFDWENAEQAWTKVLEEMDELREAIRTRSSPEHVEEEFGDVLFSLINYARFIQVEPETALERVNRKFKRRFEYIESHADRNLADMSLTEMDRLWEEAKQKLL